MPERTRQPTLLPDGASMACPYANMVRNKSRSRHGPDTFARRADAARVLGEVMGMVEPTLHPAFTRHFTGRIYDPSDSSAYDWPPFGTDEGSDELNEWAGRIDELAQNATVRYMLGGANETTVDGGSADELSDAHEALIGIGFTLLGLTGQIDDEGRQWVKNALERQQQRAERPEYLTMLTDICSFVNTKMPLTPRPEAIQRQLLWFVVRTGGGDAELTKWCRQIERVLATDMSWSNWWTNSGLSRIEFYPSLDAYRSSVEMRTDKDLIVVHAGNWRLGKLSRRHSNVETTPQPSLMTVPQVPELLDELAHTVLRTIARRSRVSQPPVALPLRR